MDRRSFISSAAALVGSIRERDDFPIVAERTYLNSAYIAPIPRQVVAAGTAFLEAKSRRPLEVNNDLLAPDETLRRQFAALVNATPDEVGLLFSTAEGENIIAHGLDLKAGDNVVIDELHYPTEFVLSRAARREASQWRGRCQRLRAACRQPDADCVGGVGVASEWVSA
jgi:selenocysteine lyase/cysteine desulfurase